MPDALRIGLVVGLILSPLAGLMAFLITYEEYRRHYPDRRPAVRAALQVAAFSFVAFLALSMIGGMLALRMAR